MRRALAATWIAALALTLAADAQGPAFDAVSVKAADPSDPVRVNGWNLRGGRLNLRNVPLRQIIRMAYAPGYRLFPGLPLDRMSGGPAWVDTDLFVVEARAPEGSLAKDAERQFSLMVRALLADRFKLRARIEIRQLPVYVLTLDRADRGLGAQLKPAAKPDGPTSIGGGRGRWFITNVPAHGLASALEEHVLLPVIDRTGLTGGFDGTMEWTPEIGELRGPADPNASPPTGPSIYTAIREQLGLRLVRDTGPVEFLVIDSVERPSEN